MLSEYSTEGVRYSVALSLMAVLVVMGTLFSGSAIDIPFFFLTSGVALLAGLWFLRGEYHTVHTNYWIGYAFVGLFTFAAWAVLSSLWAYIPGHAAMQGLAWILVVSLVVLGYIHAAYSQNGRLVYIATVVFVSAGLAAYSIYLFVNTNVVSARLFFPFGLPNVNGGFFIMPFFLSLGMVFREFLISKNNFRHQSIWAGCLVFLGTALVLTFSRASWVAVIGGLISFFLLIGLSTIKKIGFKKLLFFICVGVIITGLSFFAYIPHWAPTENQRQWVNFFVRPGETKTINNYVLRQMYTKDALSYVPSYFPFGAGGRSYEQVMRLHKENLEGWTVDPHNGPVRFLLEYGIFVLGLYFFVGVLLVYLFIAVRSRRDEDALLGDKVIVGSVLAGALAVLAHSCVDVDWSYPQLVALCLLTMSVTVGFEGRNENGLYVVIPRFMMASKVVIVISGVLIAGVFVSFTSLVVLRQTKSNVASGMVAHTQPPYLFYWMDPRIGVERGVGFMNAIMRGDESFIDDAEREFALVEKYSPFDSAPYFYLAELALRRGDVQSAVALYRKSISYNKAGSYIERSRLLSLFVDRHMVIEGISLAKENLSLYEPYTKSLMFPGDPSKDDISMHVAYWQNILATAPKVQ